MKKQNRGRPEMADSEVKKNRCVRVSDKNIDLIKSHGFTLQEFVDGGLIEFIKLNRPKKVIG